MKVSKENLRYIVLVTFHYKCEKFPAVINGKGTITTLGGKARQRSPEVIITIITKVEFFLEWVNDSFRNNLVLYAYKKNLKRKPADTKRWTNAGLMSVHRLRRCPNINPALVQHLVFAEKTDQRNARAKTKATTAREQTRHSVFFLHCPCKTGANAKKNQTNLKHDVFWKLHFSAFNIFFRSRSHWCVLN